MNALLARDAGVKRVILIDPNEFRLDFGKRMGFEVLRYRIVSSHPRKLALHDRDSVTTSESL
jgi:threonine dehydrogenase-like Zn-dependent dehydrogenase